MKNSVKVQDHKGSTYYSLNYYTIVGRHLVRNYDARVMAIINNY